MCLPIVAAFLVFYLIVIGKIEALTDSCNFCDWDDLVVGGCSPNSEYEIEFPEKSCGLAKGKTPLCKAVQVTACTPNVFGAPGNIAQHFYKYGCADESELVEGRPSECYWERSRTARDIVVQDKPGYFVIAPSIIRRTCYCKGVNCNDRMACDCGPSCNNFSSDACTSDTDCDCMKDEGPAKCGMHPDVFILEPGKKMKRP